MVTNLGHQIHFYYILDSGKILWIKDHFFANCDNECADEKPEKNGILWVWKISRDHLAQDPGWQMQIRRLVFCGYLGSNVDSFSLHFPTLNFSLKFFKIA